MAATLTSTDAVQFVLDEGRLLNESRYTEWLSLFAPDGMYWVPLEGDRQADRQCSRQHRSRKPVGTQQPHQRTERVARHHGPGLCQRTGRRGKDQYRTRAHRGDEPDR